MAPYDDRAGIAVEARANILQGWAGYVGVHALRLAALAVAAVSDGGIANFQLDSFHEAFVNKFGASLIPRGEQLFANWWLGLYPDLPPRLANECIWLAIENKIVNPW